MFKVTTNSKYEGNSDGNPQYIKKTTSSIPMKYRPFILSLVYTIFIGSTALLLNGIFEVTFNQTIAFRQPFYFTILYITVLSFLLPYKFIDKTIAVEKTNLDGFQVQKVVPVIHQKYKKHLLVLAKVTTLILSFTFFLSSYSSNKNVEKYERITIHNVPIKGIDSVQIAVRLSRNTRDSATPGRFKVANEATVSKKKTYIYEEYTYGFPYKLLKPVRKRDLQQGKKYLEGKRAKIFVKWYGSDISPMEVEGKIDEIIAPDAMDDLLIESFGIEVKEEKSTKK